MGINEICDSVGAIIRNGKGEYLVLYRLEKPTGLALPAGHFREREESGDAIRRVVFEKTGIRLIDIRRICERPIKAKYQQCRLGSKLHWWYLYETLSWDGALELKQPDRHKFVKFMPLEEMQSFVDSKEMVVAWPVFILKDMGIL